MVPAERKTEASKIVFFYDASHSTCDFYEWKNIAYVNVELMLRFKF